MALTTMDLCVGLFMEGYTRRRRHGTGEVSSVNDPPFDGQILENSRTTMGNLKRKFNDEDEDEDNSDEEDVGPRCKEWQSEAMRNDRRIKDIEADMSDIDDYGDTPKKERHEGH
jgi:hypothetical protein